MHRQVAVEQIVDIPVHQEQVEIVQVPKIVEQRLVMPCVFASSSCFAYQGRELS